MSITPFKDLKVALKNAAHRVKFGNQGNIVKWHGTLTVDPAELERAVSGGWAHDAVSGWRMEQVGPGTLLFLPNPNLVVDVGVNRSLDRLFDIGGSPSKLQTIGVDDGTTNPVAASLSSTNGGGADSGSSNRRLVAFDSAATRSNQVVSADGTFTDATVSFTIKRLFLSANAAGTTDSDGTLYAMTNVFTMDLSAFSTWSQTFTAEVTGSGS